MATPSTLSKSLERSLNSINKRKNVSNKLAETIAKLIYKVQKRQLREEGFNQSFQDILNDRVNTAGNPKLWSRYNTGGTHNDLLRYFYDDLIKNEINTPAGMRINPQGMGTNPQGMGTNQQESADSAAASAGAGTHAAIMDGENFFDRNDKIKTDEGVAGDHANNMGIAMNKRTRDDRTPEKTPEGVKRLRFDITNMVQTPGTEQKESPPNAPAPANSPTTATATAPATAPATERSPLLPEKVPAGYGEEAVAGDEGLPPPTDPTQTEETKLYDAAVNTDIITTADASTSTSTSVNTGDGDVDGGDGDGGGGGGEPEVKLGDPAVEAPQNRVEGFPGQGLTGALRLAERMKFPFRVIYHAAFQQFMASINWVAYVKYVEVHFPKHVRTKAVLSITADELYRMAKSLRTLHGDDIRVKKLVYGKESSVKDLSDQYQELNMYAMGRLFLPEIHKVHTALREKRMVMTDKLRAGIAGSEKSGTNAFEPSVGSVRKREAEAEASAARPSKVRRIANNLLSNIMWN